LYRGALAKVTVIMAQRGGDVMNFGMGAVPFVKTFIPGIYLLINPKP